MASPGHGTVGNNLMARVESFVADVAYSDLCHYVVAINPESESRATSEAVIKELFKSHGSTSLGGKLAAYDGMKNMYTAGSLPFESKEFVIKLIEVERRGTESRAERKYNVTIQFARKADMRDLRQYLKGRQRDTPQDNIQVLFDIVRRKLPYLNNVAAPTSFLSTQFGHRGGIGEGQKCSRGYHQSLRPAWIGLPLNTELHGSGVSSTNTASCSNRQIQLGNAGCIFPIFWNVIIRSLWHLKQFRDEFVRNFFAHVHTMNVSSETSCIICVLYRIFILMSEDNCTKAFPLASINNFPPAMNAFQLAKNNAASGAIQIILQSLHTSCTCLHFDCSSPTLEKLTVHDCERYMCLAHIFFGINLYEKMKCGRCSKVSQCSNYTSFSWKVDASLLKTTEKEHFEDLLRTLTIQCFCGFENNSSGGLSSVDRFLTNLPPFFTAVFDWSKAHGTDMNVLKVFTSISFAIDLGLILKGGLSGQKYSLVSVICCNEHGLLLLLARDCEKKNWVVYNGTNDEEVDDWNELVERYAAYFWPEVLFFEALQ